MRGIIMTVIFQLFCVEDLKKLTNDELTELRQVVANALGLTKSATGQTPSPLCLGVTDKTEPNAGAPQEIIKALHKRFDEVAHQLKSPSPSPSGQNFNFRERNQQRNTPSSQENTILEWAISCEVNNYDFYIPLLRAKEAAYRFFEEKVRAHMQARGETPPDKIRPIGPDSLYSPFNRRHPLSYLFYNL
jgi:hypothetical protein